MTSCRRNERCQKPLTSRFDFFFPFCFREETPVQKLVCAHYGGYWYTVTFWIRVVSELSRRHGNHKPQRFDFLNECQLNDGTCQFYFSYNEKIFFDNNEVSILAGGAFLKSFSIYWQIDIPAGTCSRINVDATSWRLIHVVTTLF